MTKSAHPQQEDPPILVFDGTCILCHSFFQWVIKKDRNKIFRFATLQSEAGKVVLGNLNIPGGYDTVLLKLGGRIYTYSTAALKTLIILGGFYGWLGRAGFVFPRIFRDWVYRIIARNRYRWFGNKECLVPDEELRDRFE
ncbi:MAG TPA: DCC1-like thiol-disulfide oxidoreductase family protein [Saprospiraceae bacterium]|nr:DCC1-like thiol-disulfide oxidoreductase family protein [Saprospiraceae bacterium]